MAENPTPSLGVTDNDRLLAAISYPIPLVGIVILLVEDMKNRPFQRYHAVQALAANILLWILIGILSVVVGAVSAGLCGCGPSILWFITLYWAYLAYKGQNFEIPWLTQFLKKQNWL
jgi:uncharacterized membrane protein